jgi:hypothetical protein
MIEGQIKFVASVDYDGDVRFDVTISKGKIETHSHFYADVDTWKQFGEQLTTFPKNVADKEVFDASYNGPYRDSLLLEAYCYNTQGHTAVRVSADNNEPPPNRCQLDFSIPAEAASINRLGQLLLNWQVENDSEIIWEAQTS